MNNFEQIEKYLLGKMTEEERVAFEARLSSEPELNVEKESMSHLILGVESYVLKQKLQGRKIGEEESGKVVDIQSKSSFSFQKLAIAASVIGILFCGWWFLSPDLNPEDQLYSNVFTKDPGLPTKMSETQNYTFYDAMVEYKMENYDLAIDVWSNYDGSIGQDTIDYYLGMAYLNAENYEEASKKLLDIPLNSAFSNKSKWYLVNILIREQNYDEARRILNEIPTTFHPQYEEVSKYLEKK